MSFVELIQGLLVGGGAVYIASIAWLLRGLYRLEVEGDDGVSPSLSIIVAARNEEAVLEGCLEALQKQDYMGEWEVVLVDDRSDDKTSEIATDWLNRWDRLRAVRAPDNTAFACPKKSALSVGIASAKGEVLLFTDADCRPRPDWARRTAARFSPDVGLVAGHAHTLEGHSLIQRVLSVENSAVGALGAGSFAQGRPLSCTGRNLAYRKSVYDAVGGFAPIGHMLGGDDVYFMRLVAKAGLWKMVWNSGVVVESLPAPSRWRAILHQKMRHAAKGGHYQGPALILGAGVYAFHLGLGAALCAMGLGASSLEVLWPVWCARWGVDALLLYRMREGDLWGWLKYFPLVEVLYIPYVVLLAPAGRLGLFRWKS